MPNPTKPNRRYGAPLGTPAPDPNRQRTAPAPGKDNYLEHMIAAHKAFEAKQAPAAPPARVKGSSTNAKSTRGSIPGVEAQLKKAGA